MLFVTSETEDKTTLNGHYTCATSASPQSRFRNEKARWLAYYTHSHETMYIMGYYSIVICYL